MDKFIVSARKYRPQNFSTVVGQQHITTTLKNAINQNQLAHAFLFCGPRGVGKTTCARILAKTINCTNKTTDGEACNTCTSCVSFDNGSSMNIHELDAASNNSVEDIRNLADQVRFAPQAGDYKVYIVDEVHMLSTQAFNAFLKTLEEPPAYAIFILATTEKHKILPTILSRCQIFDFKRITTTDTVEHLQEICEKENIVAAKAALHVIAQKSEGCMRDSLSILYKIVSFTGGKITYANTLEHLNILDEDYFFLMLDHMRGQALSSALLLYDSINQKGFEGDTFLDGLMAFLRNLLVSTDPKAITLLDVAQEFKTKYLQQAQQVHTSWMIAALNIVNEYSIGYKEARNKKLFVEMMLIKLSYLQQAIDISTNDTDVIKKKITDEAKPVAFKILPPRRMPAVQYPKNEQEISTLVAVESPQPSLLITERFIVEPKQASLSTVAADNKPITNPAEPIAETTTLSSLKTLRKKIAEKNNLILGPKPLTVEELQKAILLKAPALTSNTANILQDAAFSVVDNNCFSITVRGTMQQKFIDAEKTMLIDFLQEYFNNRQLKYIIEVLPPAETADKPTKVLNKKEQYALLCEQYPQIGQLKAVLKLDLD